MSLMDWSQGYVTDIPYIEGFTRELSPSWLNYVAAISGCVPRDISQDFNYIELGCGLGVTSAILAGSYPKGQFYGVDFNPAHIDLANRNAAQWGISNVRFIERSFEQLLDLDLPEFDFITLHGVYVWVDPAIQASIRRFIREKLKPGGLVYISYNCMPGWAMDAPLRKWLFEFAGLVPGNSLTRVSHAMNSLQKANELNVGYFKVSPNSAKPLDRILKQKPNYVAHEYLNEHWLLPYSVDVADQLMDAKLNFVGSATLSENTLDFSMPKEAAQYVRNLPTPRLRQLAGDYFTYRRFRRDVFVRGHGHLPNEAIIRHVREQLVGLVRPVADITDKIKLPMGEISINDPSLSVIKEVLEKGVQTIGSIESQVSGKMSKRSQTERILTVLVAADIIIPFAQAYETPKLPTQIRKVSWRHPVNKSIAQSSLTLARGLFLANPVMGNGWVIDPVPAAILSVLDGKSGNMAELIKRVDEKLKTYGIVLQSSSESKDAEGQKSEAKVETKPQMSPQQNLERAIAGTLKRVIPLMAQVGLLDVA